MIGEFPGAVPRDLCEQLRALYDTMPDLAFPGRCGIDKDRSTVKPDLKRCKDIGLLLAAEHDAAVAEAVERLWSFVDRCMGDWAEGQIGLMLMKKAGIRLGFGGFQMQRYESSDYFRLHVDSSCPFTADRVLAGIIYLNDVAEGGETIFHAHSRTIRPEAGKIVFFPPYWTHPHEGVPPRSGVKDIVTFFMFYVPAILDDQIKAAEDASPVEVGVADKAHD